MKYSILIVFLLVFSLPSLKAQAEPFGSPSITNFFRSDYKAGTQNWAILQDKRGIVYFANNKGLLEFDGTNWQTFSLPNTTIVRSLSFDTDGILYIGAQSEMGYMEPNAAGKNIFISLAHLIPEASQGFEDIWKIFIQEESRLFCSEKAIFRITGDKVKIISPGEGRFENFFQNEGKIFIQDKEKGLFLLEEDELVPYPDGAIFKDGRIVAILPYKNNESLIVTVTKGLFLMNESGIRPWQVEATDFLSTNQAYCGIKLSDGRYAIGTSQNGLLIIDQEGSPAMHLNQENGLQNNTILSIFQDVQQNLWLGMDNGIDYAIINSPFSTIRSVEGIEGTGYASIVHQDNLYLGTNQGLFYIPWPDSNKLTAAEKFKPVKNTIGQVWSLNKLGNDVIVGQHKGALYLKEKEAVPFSTVQGAWKFLALEAHPGYAIEGTYSGIIVYKNQHPENAVEQAPDWKMIGKLEGFNESARVFEEDETGNIWVSHIYKGLYKLELSDDLKSVKKTTTYDSSNGLPVDLFINVSKIRKELIFTTPKGIFKYNKKEDRFEPHEEFTEIFDKNKNVHYLKEDELGNIWFAIDDDFGVLKVQEKGVFNKVERLYFNQIQEDLVDGFEHIYAYDKSNVFIGTEKGFIHYDPSKNKDTAFPFKILIRKVTSITEGDSILYWGNQVRDSSLAPRTFNYKMNDFRFDFSAPYYEKIDQLHYRFKLEGFEDSWSKWTARTEKDYTNLAAGDYQFKIQARNAYGQLSTEEVFAFSILPPWYLSIYAKIAYLILAIVSLTGLIKYVSKREKKKTEAFKRAQVEKMERREAEFKVEAEKSEREIVALRNEKLQTDIDLKNSQLASATMHLVQKSEILVKIKNELNNLLANASKENKRKIQQISRTIESDIRLDDNWDQFESHFDQVHKNFFKRLREKHPELTPKDQKLCAYLRMNLTTKEVAPLMNISIRGVEISRYRLRKKLKLDSDTNLVNFILNI